MNQIVFSPFSRAACAIFSRGASLSVENDVWVWRSAVIIIILCSFQVLFGFRGKIWNEVHKPQTYGVKIFSYLSLLIWVYSVNASHTRRKPRALVFTNARVLRKLQRNALANHIIVAQNFATFWNFMRRDCTAYKLFLQAEFEIFSNFSFVGLPVCVTLHFKAVVFPHIHYEWH